MASRPLKNLARKPIRTDDMVRFFQAFHKMSDQAIALVCGAWVERSLERAILSRLRRLSKTQYRELFVAMAPIATFSAKIKIAFALKILGRSGVSDLEAIKDIRNQFAHSFHPITFRTRQVAAHCRKLRVPEIGFAYGLSAADKKHVEIDKKRANDPRVRFTTACGFISTALGGRGVHGPRPQPPRNHVSRAILH